MSAAGVKHPDNKIIFALCRRASMALKREGIKIDGDAAQIIFNEIALDLRGRMGGGGELSIAPEPLSDVIQRFIDNPMTAEEEAKALRAILHAGLSKGDISPQILDKLDRIIGISTGEDDKIEIVDFSEAFPDLATAVNVCMKMLSQKAEEGVSG